MYYLIRACLGRVAVDPGGRAAIRGDNGAGSPQETGGMMDELKPTFYGGREL